MNTKYYVVQIALFAIFSIFFNACEKEDLKKEEMEKLAKYIESKGITATPTASGLYYIETQEGSGSQVVVGNKVKVKYEGRLLNGDIFDSADVFEFTLGAGQVIKGWDEGIAYMKVGGKATLIIPSELAYGPTGSGSIPAYSTLIFDVTLLVAY